MQITYLRVDIEPTSPFRVGSPGGARNTLAVETDDAGRPYPLILMAIDADPA